MCSCMVNKYMKVVALCHLINRLFWNFKGKDNRCFSEGKCMFEIREKLYAYSVVFGNLDKRFSLTQFQYRGLSL